MIKKTVIVVLVASALYAAAVNMKIKGTTSGAERSFTRRIGGVNSYLPNAPTYYKQYVPRKLTCHNRKPCVGQYYRKPKQASRYYPRPRFAGRCPWQCPMRGQMRCPMQEHMRDGHMKGHMDCPMMQKQEIDGSKNIIDQKTACKCPQRKNVKTITEGDSKID